jgi:hypothetical protein
MVASRSLTVIGANRRESHIDVSLIERQPDEVICEYLRNRWIVDHWWGLVREPDNVGQYLTPSDLMPPPCSPQAGHLLINPI